MGSGPETAIVKAIVAELERRGALVVKMHGSAYTPSGCPDLLGVLPGGRALALEVKTSAGSPSALQLRAVRRWSERGAAAGVVRSVEDAVAYCFDGSAGGA